MTRDLFDMESHGFEVAADAHLRDARGRFRSAGSCCICGGELGRFGHNPAPVRDSGDCCGRCNENVVIPARIAQVSAAS